MSKYLDDVLCVCGAVLIVIGIWQICPAAAWVAAGAFFIAAGVLIARAQKAVGK